MSTTELGLIIVAAVVAGLIKSISGMGYPLILLPVLALFIDIDEAIIIVAFSNFALNALLLFNTRDQATESPTLRPFVLASIVGGALGALLLPILSDRALRMILVAIVAAFLLNKWRSPSFAIGQDRARQLAPGVGAAAGLMQGAAGVSGPIVSAWFLSVGLSRQAFVFSITTVFALSGLAQIVVLALQGLFTRDLLIPSLILVPTALSMVPIGVWLRSKISVPAFDRLVVGLLVASALTILIRLF